MHKVLAEIVAHRRRDVRSMRAHPIRACGLRTPRAGFFDSVSRPGRVNIIAEIKCASPTLGRIRSVFDPAARAREYLRGGAVALSVLTEERYFQGSLEHLAAVRSAVDLPVLMKDFVVHEKQIAAGAKAGANAVLLIVRLLSLPVLKRLMSAAEAAGMDTLVETHSLADMAKAAQAGARLIGVNNRDLDTLVVDRGAGARLLSAVPSGSVGVIESGIRTRRDIDRFARAGARAFLIGEALLLSRDATAALQSLTGRERNG